MSTTIGYPGTPLSKKLGIKTGFIIKLVNQPNDYWKLFNLLPEGIIESDNPNVLKDFIHVFYSDEDKLKKELKSLKKEIKQNGMIWVSWPKKASQVPTTVNENVIRKYAFSNKLVDVKVCAVNEIWSGLKLVIPIKDRLK